MAFGIRSVDHNLTSFLLSKEGNYYCDEPTRRPPVGEASKPIARSLLLPLVFAQSILTQPPLSGLAIMHILMSVLETVLKPNLLPP